MADELCGGMESKNGNKGELDGLVKRHYLQRILLRNRFSTSALEQLLTSEHIRDTNHSIAENFFRAANEPHYGGYNLMSQSSSVTMNMQKYLTNLKLIEVKNSKILSISHALS
jgi:hypothetical protein